eukprot:4891435-Amphidinium_carterae.1
MDTAATFAVGKPAGAGAMALTNALGLLVMVCCAGCQVPALVLAILRQCATASMNHRAEHNQKALAQRQVQRGATHCQATCVHTGTSQSC